MEIRRKPYNKTVEYHMITRGECFALSDEIDTIYMKISPIEDRDYKGWNAVRLYDGDISVFNDFQEVIPINSVLEID